MTKNSILGAFFHRTVVGRSLTKHFWNFVTGQAEKAAGFGKDGNNIEGLQPDVCGASCFWCDTSIGLITMSDFLSTLRKGNITILRDSVEYLDVAGATVRSGKTVAAQYMIYCTGWGDHFSFFSPNIKEELGISPYGITNSHENSTLSDDPNSWKLEPNRAWTQRRWRLYNRCVPINLTEYRSFVILGQIHTVQSRLRRLQRSNPSGRLDIC
ncbi:hypothetical protein BGW36DRAFT_445486 [Talaromyces proteolyticus]|uniref:Uncharacterized protein n=1 Tax=Talaromyces proteolyticus TaxID=1131652 RepID=A0AAD4Q3L9_9EURO|nr:uncharacterized protein BGW36DRAFT_445486 [Talaromyces proteolyticus]KAH8701872.1 hypothetical protein BGW36DRAFT_445486 [Talaromyces proteolyticus]